MEQCSASGVIVGSIVLEAFLFTEDCAIHGVMCFAPLHGEHVTRNLGTANPPLLLNHLLHTVHWTAPACSSIGGLHQLVPILAIVYTYGGAYHTPI